MGCYYLTIDATTASQGEGKRLLPTMDEAIMAYQDGHHRPAGAHQGAP